MPGARFARLLFALLAALALGIGVLDYVGAISGTSTLAASLQAFGTIILVWVTFEYVRKVDRQAEARDRTVELLLLERRREAVAGLEDVLDATEQLHSPVRSQLWYIEEKDQTLGSPSKKLVDGEAIERLRQAGGRIGADIHDAATEAADAMEEANPHPIKVGRADDREAAVSEYADALREADDALTEVRDRAEVALEELRAASSLDALTEG